MIDEPSAVISEQMERAVKEFEAKKTELLAHAYVAGYDGVDILLDLDDVRKVPSPMHASFRYEAWEEEPQRIPPLAQALHRYDLRGLDKQEERELLAHIGLQPEDVDR